MSMLLWRCTLHTFLNHFITILRFILTADKCRHLVLTFLASQYYRNQSSGVDAILLRSLSRTGTPSPIHTPQDVRRIIILL